MSDVVRVYSGSGGSGRGRNRKRFHLVRWVVLALVVTCVIYALWISRDTHVPESFIPSDQRLQIVVVDPLVKREALAASSVWEAMPAFTGLQQVPTMLRNLSDAPEWMLNNLIGEVCRVSANDTQAFSDLLFVTTMTRVGVWIERGFSLRGDVERDKAGGLDLRKLPGQELYYAVRGRTLVASRSRDALIRALTLRASEAAALENVTGDHPRGNEDLSGTILLTQDDPLGSVFASMSFAVLVQDTTLRVLFRGVPTAFWQQQLAAAPDLGPRSLPHPPEGMIAASLNLGLPVRDTWALLGATGLPLFSAEQWDNWSTLADDEAPGVAYFLTTLTGSLGPGVGLSLNRVDVNALFPMPEVVAVLEARAADIDAAYAALPQVPDAAAALTGYPHLNADTKLVSYPMPAGPVLEPTAAPYGSGLLLSNSRVLAEELIAAGPPAQAEPLEGNLYVRVLPAQCVTAAAEVGRLLAEGDLLKGYDAASFEDAAAEWLATASGVREATLKASCVDGEISGELRVETLPR